MSRRNRLYADCLVGTASTPKLDLTAANIRRRHGKCIRPAFTTISHLDEEGKRATYLYRLDTQVSLPMKASTALRIAKSLRRRRRL